MQQILEIIKENQKKNWKKQRKWKEKKSGNKMKRQKNQRKICDKKLGNAKHNKYQLE